jgi:exodeoxyribonuclease V gamma subunit
VLVSQLRDYLEAGWNLDLASLTTEHALQPFSRKYFENGGLLTYAGEWRAAHGAALAQDDERAAERLPPFELDPNFRLKLNDLANFMRQPVKYFFRRRLSVTFADADLIGDDEEPFALNALERYLLEDTLLDDADAPEPESEVRASLTLRAKRLEREGVLPIGLIGEQWQRQLVDALVPVRTAWLKLCQRFPRPAEKLAIDLRYGELRIEDWLDQLRRQDESAGGKTAWLMQISSKVLDKNGKARGDKLIAMWLRQLAAAAQDVPVTGYLLARDAVVTMAPLEPAGARDALAALLALWRENMNHPLPTACKTALALAQDGDPRAVYDGGFDISGERADLCLARQGPDFAALAAEEAWADCSLELYGPLAAWLDNHITIAAIDAGAEAP